MDSAIPCAGVIRCIDCEYDLRGHAADGRCPECGKPVDASLAFPGLRRAGVSWIQRLRRRTRVAAWAIPGMIALMAICITLGELGVLPRQSLLLRTLTQTPTLAMMVIPLALALRPPAELNTKWRRRRLWAWPICIAALIEAMLEMTMSRLPPVGVTVLKMLMGLVTSLPLLLGGSLAIALATAIPSRSLARSARLATMIFACGTALVVVENVTHALWWRTDSPALAHFMMIVKLLSAILLFGGIIFLCVVLIRLHLAIGRLLRDFPEIVIPVADAP